MKFLKSPIAEEKKYLSSSPRKVFFNALKNPHLHEYSFFENQWQALENKIKNETLKFYKKSKFCTVSQILLNPQKKKDSHLVLDLLLSNGFSFNKKDLKTLKINNWMKFRHVYNTQYWEPNIYRYPKMFLFGLKSKFRKPKPVLTIVDIFSADVNAVLVKHYHLLPSQLQSKVIYCASSTELLQIYEQDSF